MKKQVYTFKEGLRDGVPIGLGYLSVSFGFGIAVVAAGLSPLIALLISMSNETSAGQKAGLDIIIAHGGQISARNHADGAEFYFSLPKEESNDEF